MDDNGIHTVGFPFLLFNRISAVSLITVRMASGTGTMGCVSELIVVEVMDAIAKLLASKTAYQLSPVI